MFPCSYSDSRKRHTTARHTGNRDRNRKPDPEPCQKPESFSLPRLTERPPAMFRQAGGLFEDSHAYDMWWLIIQIL